MDAVTLVYLIIYLFIYSYFQIDAVTPVYSNMDPIQAFLSQERLSAFMARDDSLGELPDYGPDAAQDNKVREEGKGVCVKSKSLASSV